MQTVEYHENGKVKIVKNGNEKEFMEVRYYDNGQTQQIKTNTMLMSFHRDGDKDTHEITQGNITIESVYQHNKTNSLYARKITNTENEKYMTMWFHKNGALEAIELSSESDMEIKSFDECCRVYFKKVC